MFNLEKGKIAQAFNAAGQSSALGPPLSEIRNVEVQKTAPPEQHPTGEGDTADEGPAAKGDEEEAA